MFKRRQSKSIGFDHYAGKHDRVPVFGCPGCSKKSRVESDNYLDTLCGRATNLISELQDLVEEITFVANRPELDAIAKAIDNQMAFDQMALFDDIGADGPSDWDVDTQEIKPLSRPI